jgi:lysophospholipase L1-like esterase
MKMEKSQLHNRMGRLSKVIAVGILIIVIEVIFIYGHRFTLEVSTAKLTGDGDSLMASSSVLRKLQTKLEIESGKEWFIQNNAGNGYRMRIEVARDQRASLFSFRLPWKTMDRIWVIGGTNDLGMGGPQRVDKLLDVVEEYFQRQRQAGYSKSLCYYTDILPRNTPGDATFDRDRQRFNSLVPQRLSELANVIHSGSNPLLSNPLDTAIFFDGTHLTEAGNEIVAEDAFEVMRAVTAKLPENDSK